MRNRVSVAMVTFNGETYLRDQIESILLQSPPPDEIVIGDDGSVDGTVALIGELTRHSPIPITMIGGDHVGLRLNVQRTIEACTGQVIALADQDDVWLPGKLAAIHEAFRDPAVALWFSDADLIGESGGPLGVRLWERVGMTPAAQAELAAGRGLRRMIYGQTVTGATMAFPASLRNLILPLPAELDGDDHLYLHDGWIAVLAFLIGRSVTDPARWIQYRRHPRQVTADPQLLPIASPGRRRRRLVTKEDLAREYARVTLVLDRLRERDCLDACREDDAATLVELASLLHARTLPPGWARVRAILRQFMLRRYSRHSRGWRTAAADLLLARG